MTHVYRIVKIADFWRLMRDDKLHSTYNSQGAAKAGMATEQRRDEQREERNDLLQQPALSMDELLHRLWTKAVGTPGYDKREWTEFERRFREIYALAYAARKGE